MIAGYQTRSNIGVGVGIVTQVVGRFLVGTTDNPGLALLGWIGMLGGAVVFIWGCCQYARGKGYPSLLGLLGLLWILGLIILVVLPDQHRQTA